MPTIDHDRNEVLLRIAFWGATLSGRSSCIEAIYNNTEPSLRGALRMLSTANSMERSFDFLPAKLAPIDNLRVRIETRAPTGTLYENSSVAEVLRDADALVFVFDAQIARIDANDEAIDQLRALLHKQGSSLENKFCTVLANKFDQQNVLRFSELERRFPFSVPIIEGCSHEGWGVLDALKAAVHPVYKKLQTNETPPDLFALSSSDVLQRLRTETYGLDREQALRVLLEREGTERTEALSLASNDSDASVRLRALRAHSVLSHPALFIKATTDPSPRVRCFAIRALEEHPREETTRALASVLRSESLRSLRMLAADALGGHSNALAQRTLEATRGTDPYVEQRAREALQRIQRMFNPTQ